jgi:hypothetical protein
VFVLSNYNSSHTGAEIDGVIAFGSGLTGNIQNQLNNKEATLTKGDLTETISSILTFTGNTNAIIGSGLTIQVKEASSSQSGYLSTSD